MPIRLFALLLIPLTVAPAFAADTAPHYTLRYDAGTETMAVRLCVPNASADLHFSADEDAERYVDSLVRDDGPPPKRDDKGWASADWHAGECLSYRAALGRIADSGRRGDGARHGNAMAFDPSVWLLGVDGAGADPPAELRVELPPGYSISAPWHELPPDGGTLRFAIPQTPDDWLARVAIGRFVEVPVALPGGTLRIAMLGGIDADAKRKLDAWLAKVARAAVSAYGRLPLADVQVLVVPVGASSEPVDFGQSTRGQGHGLTLFVDAAQSAAAFDHDWVAVHELSHLFHPYLGDRGSWLAEGLATYYQNVLRARVGLLTPEQAWEQIDGGFDRGRRMTRPDDVTLEKASQAEDGRTNFMRTYWSGTAYWLEVDLALRRTSGNRLSVDEALRRFDACCLPSYRAWAPEDFVARLDELLGTDVFRKRFAEFRARHDFPDLAPIYADLGIRRDGGALHFAEDAPAAEARRAIMRAR